MPAMWNASVYFQAIWKASSLNRRHLSVASILVFMRLEAVRYDFSMCILKRSNGEASNAKSVLRL